MYLRYEQVAADNTVKTVAALNVHANATLVELQACTNDVRYTMDNATNPTQTSGMVLLTTQPPKTFLIEDLNRIRFTRGAAVDGNLNLHYAAGRNI